MVQTGPSTRDNSLSSEETDVQSRWAYQLSSLVFVSSTGRAAEARLHGGQLGAWEPSR